MNSDQVLDEDLNAKLISFLILSFHTVSFGFESISSNFGFLGVAKPFRSQHKPMGI
jgi:hypothetical protein